MTIKRPEIVDRLWSHAKMGYAEPKIDPDIVTEFVSLVVKEAGVVILAQKYNGDVTPEVALDLAAKRVKAYFGVE